MGYEKRKRTIVSTDVSAKRCFWRIAWCHVERAEVEFQPNVHGRNLGFQWIIPNVALENSDLTASSCRRLFHPSLKVISPTTRLDTSPSTDMDRCPSIFHLLESDFLILACYNLPIFKTYLHISASVVRIFLYHGFLELLCNTINYFDCLYFTKAHLSRRILFSTIPCP